MLTTAFEVHRYRNLAWALVKLGDYYQLRGLHEKTALCYLAAVKLQSQFPTRAGEKGRSKYNQCVKQNPGVEAYIHAFRKTSWPILVRQLISSAV